MTTPTAPAVDNASLASLVTALTQLTVALQAQLAGQTPATGVAASANTTHVSTGPTIAGTSTSATTPTTPAAPAQHISTGTHPDIVAQQIVSISDGHMTWYVVTVGKVPGIYTTVFDASPNVVGISGATQLRVGSKAKAIEAYRNAWYLGNVQIVA